jgi:hypothetical protein
MLQWWSQVLQTQGEPTTATEHNDLHELTCTTWPCKEHLQHCQTITMLPTMMVAPGASAELHVSADGQLAACSWVQQDNVSSTPTLQAGNAQLIPAI